MAAPRLLAAASLLAAAAAAPASPTIPQLTIDVRNFAFAPTPIHLAAGKPVTLTFVNRSGSNHDFTAARFFASAEIRAGAAPGGAVELPPHAVRSVTLVPRAGRYKAHCSHLGHALFGMKDVIVVD